MTTVNVKTIIVPGSLDGVRLDRALALAMDLSRSAVDRLIGVGHVALDGTVVTNRSTVLVTGQRLDVELMQPPGLPRPDPTVVFGIVHEDSEVIVVDKPEGLVVHPGSGHPDGTLVNGLLARYPELAGAAAGAGADPLRPGIVHRLDRGTSGLMVVARTSEAYGDLVQKLRDRLVSRRYRSLVAGRMSSDEGVVDAPIGRSASAPRRMAVSRTGKEARTTYRVVQRFSEPGDATLIDVVLETGRTHQVRVHLAAIGHPVFGDDAYAGGLVFPGSVLRRPFLHAAALAFEHPEGGWRSFESELPEDLQRQLGALS